MPLRSAILAGDLLQGNGPVTANNVQSSTMTRGKRHGIYLVGNDDPLWERLARDETLSIYRKKAWKDVIEQTYGHAGEYIAAFENGTMIELLPFFLVRDPLHRRKLISTPYQGSNGGFMSGDPEVRRSAIEFVKDFAHKLKVQYVEIRSAEPLPELETAGFVVCQPLITSVLPLVGPEENWDLLTPKHRRNVRTAGKNGVEVDVSHDWDEMRLFYDMLADHYKSLGVPFPGLRFFRQMWERLVIKDHGQLLIARYEGEIIGGHLLLYNGTALVSKFSVTLHHERYAKLYAAYALYWEAIRRGVEMGFSSFDLGITGECNVGLREFKGRLGAEERPLYFYYYRLRGAIPDYESYYSSYKLARAMWKVAPKWITNVVGDYINSWLC